MQPDSFPGKFAKQVAAVLADEKRESIEDAISRDQTRKNCDGIPYRQLDESSLYILRMIDLHEELRPCGDDLTEDSLSSMSDATKRLIVMGIKRQMGIREIISLNSSGSK